MKKQNQLEKLQKEVTEKTYTGKPQTHSTMQREKGDKPVFDRLYVAAQLQLKEKLQKQKELDLAAKERPLTARTKTTVSIKKVENQEEEGGAKSARAP